MSDESISKTIASAPASRVVAGSLALAGFSIALLVGLSTGNDFESIILRAVVSLFICFVVGLITGRFCEHVIGEYVRSYVSERPVPDSDVDVEDLANQMLQERMQQTQQTEQTESN